MKISIAMATFNGEMFLRQQLQSFRSQTRLPDELVVCDDRSRDDTLAILESFSRDAPFDIHIYRNSDNLGYAGNFGKALALCTGDIIFLSDQDDVWFPEKIERVIQVFDANRSVLLVINNAEITDEYLHPSGLTLTGKTRMAGLPADQFINGCCSAVSARLLPVVLPIPPEETSHDSWIHRLAIAMKAKWIVNDVLQYYRRHSGNTWKWSTASNLKISWDSAKQYFVGDARSFAWLRIESFERMSKRLTLAQLVITDATITERLPAVISKLQSEKEIVQSRVLVLDKPRYVRGFYALSFWLRGGYRLFSGWKSLMKDLLH
jgi:glycosyltransferase involved in cell wall biosynthesis